MLIILILRAEYLHLPGISLCLSEVTSCIFFGPEACRSGWVGNTDFRDQEGKKNNSEVPGMFAVEDTALQ